MRRTRWDGTLRRASIGLLTLGLLLPATAPVQAQTAEMSAEDGVVLAEGFNAPQGILVDDEGNVLVSDSGLGGEDQLEFFSSQAMTTITATVGNSAQIVRIAPDGTQEVLADLPSVATGMDNLGGGRMALLDGTLYATLGQFSNAADVESIADMASVIAVTDGGYEIITSTWDFERANNPDATALIDSHPYGIRAGPDGMLYIADAGANDVLRLDPATGEIELVAVIDPIPGVFPSDVRNGELLADPVPTAIEWDDEGNLLVSYLSGAPFVPGSSGVKLVAADGTVSDYATGLTMLTDLRRGPDGQLYGVQFGMFTEQGPVPDAGAVVRIHGGTAVDTVVDGLTFATSLDFDDAGNLYVTTNGLGAPGSGQVLMFEGVASSEGTGTGAETGTATGPETGTGTTQQAGEAAQAGDLPTCADLPSHADLVAALTGIVEAGDSGGFGLNMWATTVSRDGEVCAVGFSGANRGDQWPGSRVISAQKANTANAFSLPDLALSTANLYAAVQPGGSLFGLQASNPVDTAVAYGGDAAAYGQADDPMVGQRIGGVNVFGGGLALYAEDGTLLGAVGVSGDTSCTDHIIAWKLRNALGLDYVPSGVSVTGDDNIVYDLTNSWGHPECGQGEVPISEALPNDYPIGAD